MYLGIPNPNVLIPVEKMTIKVIEGKKRAKRSLSCTTRSSMSSRAAST